jgi:hypothetical protein
MIDPDIWHDPWFGKLAPIEQVFFIGIISNCDDEGRILAAAPYLRSCIFIYQDVAATDIQNMLEKFSSTNRNFQLYSVNGDTTFISAHGPAIRSPTMQNHLNYPRHRIHH